MDKFFYKGTLLGIRISNFSEGTNPITDEKQPLQLIAINQPKDIYVKPHIHRPTKRTTQFLQECLIVHKGNIKIELYGPTADIVEEVILKAGEAFITISGGHAIYFLDDAQVFEVKNGPFVEDKLSF